MLREYFFPLSTSLGHFFHTQRQKSLLGSSSSGLALLSPFPSELASNDFEESGVFVGSGDLDVSVFFVDSGVFAGSGDLERLADMEMEAEGERDNVPSGVLEGSGDWGGSGVWESSDTSGVVAVSLSGLSMGPTLEIILLMISESSLWFSDIFLMGFSVPICFIFARLFSKRYLHYSYLLY